MNGNSGYEKPRIAVLGLGHVGLPTALGFVEMGREVIGVDASKVAMIQSGRAPFYEPYLDDLLVRGLASGRLTLTHTVRKMWYVRLRSCLSVSVLPRKTPAKQTLARSKRLFAPLRVI